jgi:hypothetical protein
MVAVRKAFGCRSRCHISKNDDRHVNNEGRPLT